VLNIYLVCSHGDKRLPEALAAPGIRIILICCEKSQVRESKFVDEIVAITKHERCDEFTSDLINSRELLDRIDGWVIFGRDEEMYIFSRSDLPIEIKLKMLPIRNPQAISVLGSKANFIKHCTSASVPCPTTEVIPAPEFLENSLKNFSLPVIIKSDRGSGGMAVRVVNEIAELTREPLPQSWYPLIIQKFVEGDLRGVDALFRDGDLMGWMYCDRFVFLTEFGPSVSRRYINPPTLDFEEALVKFGKATGAHGFANCSFFYLPEEERHLLFEVDLRTNAWHHLGKLFDLDWSALMQAPRQAGSHQIHFPRHLPADGVTLNNWQRTIEIMIQDRQWRTVLRLLRMSKAERSPVDYQDGPINRAQMIGLFRLLPIAFAKLLFDFLPKSLRKKLKERGATARFSSRIARV